MTAISKREEDIFNKRVKKELGDIKREPIPNVLIGLKDTDKYNIFFLVRNLDDTRFSGGEYIFKIQLPSRYPLMPPDFFILTPNGRFETNKKLCFSNSSYHGETWSPIWSIKALILGLLSLFLERNTSGIGHLTSSDEEIANLSRGSINYNRNHFNDILEMICQYNL